MRWKRGERLEFVRNPYYWRGTARSPSLDRRGRAGRRDAAVARADRRPRRDRSRRPRPRRRARRSGAASCAPRTTNVVDYLQFNLRSPPLRDARRAPGDGAGDRPAATWRRKCTVGRSSPPTACNPIRAIGRREHLPPFDPGRGAAARCAAERSRSTSRSPRTGAIAPESRSRWPAILPPPASRPTSAAIPKRILGAQRCGRHRSRARATISRSRRGRPRSIPIARICSAAPRFRRAAAIRCSFAIAATIATKSSAREHTTRAARAPHYRDAGNRLVEALPIIPLGFERRTYAVNKRLRGFRPNVLGRDYWNAWELAADPS